MLSLCRAYLIAHSEVQDRTLRRLAERLGFVEIGSALDGDPISGRAELRLDFFLVHHKLSDEAMQAVVDSIRSSVSSAIRFAPILLIADDQPFETILNYIGFGFDDVIVLPDKRSELVNRFLTQLSSDQTYILTDTYLGPDRRRFEVSDHIDSRRLSSGQHTRLTIRRNPSTGIKVLRRELFGPITPREQTLFAQVQRI
jgi:hypothetical protein